ncbi:hypothetical protein [Amycolatopsis sp. lyj-23]|uniref:hypothetical protein n=1 Tax=Amycolatopsis sp. lyj-23 TaxID=2789283 RepID=UPI00397A4B1A
MLRPGIGHALDPQIRPHDEETAFVDREVGVPADEVQFGIALQQRRRQRQQLAEAFDAREATADEGDGEQLPPLRPFRQRGGAVEGGEQPVPDRDGLFDVLEADGRSPAGLPDALRYFVERNEAAPHLAARGWELTGSTVRELLAAHGLASLADDDLRTGDVRYVSGVLPRKPHPA